MCDEMVVSTVKDMEHFLEVFLYLANVQPKTILDRFYKTAPKHLMPWDRVTICGTPGYAIEFDWEPQGVTPG